MSCFSRKPDSIPVCQATEGFWRWRCQLIEDFDGNAYRAVYAVRFESAVYVLHCFQKKAKRSIKTPQSEIELIRRRLRDAEADFAKAQKGE